MKFKFRNLGPIEETELDLHPLTIIIGPNNSAKTYIAYSLYGILKHLRTNYDSYSEIKSLLHKESDTTFSVKKDELIEKLKSIFEAETKKFKKHLTFFFQDSSRKLFSKTDYELLIEDQEIDTAISTVISGMRKGLSLEVHYDE
ncbi:MAG: AAA family ATPase, partial [Blastocatellia bacterium]|nr:AAA family ATPase [Blastocatellia bacterium]